MKICLPHLSLINAMQVGVLLGLILSLPTTAQIVPDQTLPVNSKITSDGNTHTIDGGTKTEKNLFHSFEHFSILNGQTAYFNNALDLKNIFSRVTGSSISQIDGLIRANGTANLFFLNPNGIIFGTNAALDVGGSFLASTADSIFFADGVEFSATNPQAGSLLTVSVPIGLGFSRNIGQISVRGLGHNLISQRFLPVVRDFTPRGLQVRPERTLALVGGDIDLKGSILRAPGGRIEIGSVDSGTVGLNPTNWTLAYEGVSSFKNIRLAERSLVDASGSVGGSIELQAQNIELVDGSVMLIQNLGRQTSGNIRLSASDSVSISGTDPIARILGSLRTETLGSGSGGDIVVSANELKLIEGGAIQTITYSAAEAGDITFNVSDSTKILGFSPRDLRATSNVISLSIGIESGKSGNILVETRQFTATNGGLLLSAITGRGEGGNVEIKASDFIKLSGVNPNTLAPSAISSSTGFGSAGNVKLNTSRLLLENGGRVDSSTFASGSSGSVSINASEFVEVKGTVAGSLNPSLIISSANILDELFRQTYELPGIPTLTGDSGNVTVNTQRLMVLDGALISVRNDGTGDAGNIQINAPFIELNSGGVSAATTSGLGGNIQLNSQDLRLENNSNITTTAGGIGDGGNIIINTDTLVTLENSNITANAFGGRGGNITINARGVLSDRPLSETFSASSELGIDGTVTINSPETDIQKELEQLNPQLVPIEQVLAKSCLTQRNARQGSFVSTGNGGLPVTPETPIDEFALNDHKKPTAPDRSSQQSDPIGASDDESSSHRTVYISSVTPWKPGDPIIPGEKLVRTDDGRLLFVAEASTQTLELAEELVCY